MKVLGLLLAVAVVVVAGLSVAGFFIVRALRPNAELRALVTNIAPARHEKLECSWGSSSFPGESKSYYGCLYFAPGDLTYVGRRLAARATRRGFAVSCRTDWHLLAVTARRGATIVYADIRESGFRVFRLHHLIAPADLTDPEADLVASKDVEIPPRSVFLDVTAQKRRPPYQALAATSSPGCAPPASIGS